MTDRIILDERRDFLVELSYFQLDDGALVPFIHLAVYRWSASVLRDLISLWGRLRPDLPPIIFAQGTVDDDKLAKLVSHFGFKYHSDCPCDDGLNRRLFVNYRI